LHRGIYINLDRQPHRRVRIEGELRRCGLDYVRLPAVDGATIVNPQQNPGILGCFRSHLAALELAKSWGGLTHIIEDDVVLSRHVGPFIDFAATSRLFDAFDVVFLDMWIDLTDRRLLELQRLANVVLVDSRNGPDYRQFAVVDLKGFRIGAMASYVVGSQNLGRIIADVRSGFGRRSVDAYVGELIEQGRLTACMVLPFLTGIDLAQGAESTVQTRIHKSDYDLLLRLRRGFFIDRDLADVLPAIDEYRSARPHPALDRIRDGFAATGR
jgi:GR25 family glycosyltransferase involved in LPS biosynthesis